jgi:hypothetical protein
MGTDGDERIKAGLDKTACVLGRLVLRRDVAGSSEYTEHIASRILVHRGVVEHIGQAPVAMADRQGIVGDEPLREHLLISFARLRRLGEVVGKVGADQLVSIHTGYLDRGFVDVRNLSFRTDGDERVQRGFDQAAGIIRGLLLGCNVARGSEDAQDVSAGIFVYRGVIENVGQAACPMPDRQGIVGDEPLGKHLLVAFTGFIGFGKVVGEIRADEPAPFYSCNFDRGFVDVRDLPLAADRYQRVETGLDEAPGVVVLAQAVTLNCGWCSFHMRC